MTAAAGEISRPLPKPGVFETLGASVALMRAHPVELLAPYAIVQALIVLEQLIVWGLTLNGEGLSLGTDLLHSTAVSLIGTLGWAAVIVAAGALASGVRPGLGSLFAPVLRRLLPLLGFFVLDFIILILAALPICVTAGVAAAAGAEGWLTAVLALVIGLPPFLYVMTRLALALQTFILDEAGPVEAIGESWSMASGHMPRLLGVMLLALVAVAGIQVGISFALGPAPDALRIILMGLIGIPVAVFGAVALTMFYLRIRETSPVREAGPRLEPAHGSGW